MNYTNELNLPEPLVDAVKSNHAYKEHRYSVTEVLGGTCEAILKRRHDREITEDVSQRIWALFGTAVHEVLRKAKGTETQLQENWMSVPVDGTGYELSGIFDLYDDATGTVTDYKTASTWKVKFGDFSDWRRQTLAYCWMLRKLGFDARRGEIVAFLKDHSKRDAKLKSNDGYPPHPVFQILWDFTEQDFEDMESHVTWWFSEVMHEETVPDSHLEPCSPEQRWHKPDKWAVKKKGRKTAIRVYDNKGDAYQRAAGENRQAGKDDLFYVEHREGEDTRCQSYCSVAQFCPYGRNLSQSEPEAE